MPVKHPSFFFPPVKNMVVKISIKKFFFYKEGTLFCLYSNSSLLLNENSVRTACAEPDFYRENDLSKFYLNI